jgi:hypothetical protein
LWQARTEKTNKTDSKQFILLLRIIILQK